MKSARLPHIEPTAVLAVEPLDADEFAALMDQFAPLPAPLPVAVAVSGGPDSMALALCAQRWVHQKQGGVVIALIVDHGLRPDSLKEAEQTRSALEVVGIPSEILRWQHAPVVSRLHETARRARYQLLTEACRRLGIDHLLFAHHSHDQAETILMRLAKGSGIDGLAGMPARTMVDGVQILRPLLGIKRERLAETCRIAGLPFVTDPSNASAKFARGRLRRIMPLLADEGFNIDRLNDLGLRAAEAKAALDHATEIVLRVATKLDPGGVIHFDLDQLRSAPRAIAKRALTHCLQSIHPEDYAPEHASLTRLLDALNADASMPACTLHGCLISKGERHATIMREYAAITDAPSIAPGQTVLWDNRWRVSLPTTAEEKFTIRPLGNPPHVVLHILASGLRRQVPSGRTRASLPSLWFNGALALIPALPLARYQALASAEPAISWPPVMPG